MSQVVQIAQDLVRCPSVTPTDAGALGVVQRYLEPLGFSCTVVEFSNPKGKPTLNLYARRGTSGPNLCFAGHTDVVSPEPLDQWTKDPFGGDIVDGILYGRGICDMKGGIAAYLASLPQVLSQNLPGSLSLLITGDEEGDGINGTEPMIDWLKAKGETLDACLVGEPTNPTTLGEMVKAGRRGSLNTFVTVSGKSGHLAYPANAMNPIPPLMTYLTRLTSLKLDGGTDFFQPSHLELSSFDVGNQTLNMIPALALATFNIRFNTLHTAESLKQMLKDMARETSPLLSLDFSCNAHPFQCESPRLRDVLVQAIQDILGQTPQLSTSGGTSDARFIKDLCPVIEFGLVNKTAHAVDENALVKDLENLTQIYAAFIAGFFSPNQ